jgi:hypothetical protein
MDRAKRPSPHEPTPDDAADALPSTDGSALDAGATRPVDEPEPPHTTTGKITSPKFGSAGSGGLEYEGNLPVD